jgi:carboxymethylenebutenolidase
VKGLLQVVHAMVALSGSVVLAGCHGARPTTIGVRDGRLAACPSNPNCVSSLAADDVHRVAPFPFAGTAAAAIGRLTGIVRSLPRTSVVAATDTYLYAEFTSAVFRFVDDVEFFADEPAGVIQVRSASRVGSSDLGVNRKRIEIIRARWSEQAAAIPPGEAGAKAALETSPRHHEWVDLAPAVDAGKLSLFVAYPERREKAPVVVLIHEVYGLTDWVRAVADRLAAEGFIAIAPDMLTGRGPGGGGTEKFASRDDVVKAVRDLAPAQVTAALDAAARYGRSLPAASGRLATIGFCWGGAQSFRYATARSGLDAAVVYYGTSPELPALADLRAPVLGLYGEDDARVNATVGPAEARARELGKSFVAATYPRAGHGFLRAQDGREGANLAASLRAWPATLAFLRAHLE